MEKSIYHLKASQTTEKKKIQAEQQTMRWAL